MSWNARLGLILFSAYATIYFAFVFVNALAPAWMESRRWLDLNLAVWWGLGLIALAIALAVIYGSCCRATDSPVRRKGQS